MSKELSGLEEIRVRLRNIATVIHESNAMLDRMESSYLWLLKCPNCHEYIQKARRDDPWICKCGWRSE